MQYTFDDGITRLLACKELLRVHHHLSIPQPDGSTVDIELKDPSEVTMVLGVIVCPAGDGMPMLRHMLSKGYKWSPWVLMSTLRQASNILCISSTFTSSATKVHLHCDNMGVVHHASHPEATLKSNQAQADVLAVIARNLEATTTLWEYHHVYGHLDANTEFSQLTTPQQMNLEALLEAIEMGQYCKPFFPNEPMRLMVGGAKITSSIKASLYHNWGHISAKELFAQKGIVHKSSTAYIGMDCIYS